MNSITLPSGRKIGKDEKPFIIAEIGSNWRDLADCRHAIGQAKAAGADAVKFQLFNPVALYGDVPATWDMPIKVNGEGPYMPHDWLPHLKDKADKCGIEFMCSAFSPELIEAVDPFVTIHKLASAEMTHLRMLEKLSKLGKPVIMSTGASGKADIRMALNALGHSGGGYMAPVEQFPVPVVLMYCVAAYPARDIKLGMINSLMEFGCPVGYSDHSTDINVIPMAAIQAGACVIEKHMTAIEADTPDRPHSLTVDEFKRMVQTIRGEDMAAWGSGEERPMIVRHNRRLIVTKDVAQGETLKEGVNFGIFRSLKDDTKGLTPFAAPMVNGKFAAQALRAGDSIGPKDFT